MSNLFINNIIIISSIIMVHDNAGLRGADKQINNR